MPGVRGGEQKEEHAGVSEQSKTTQIKSSLFCFGVVFFFGGGGEKVASCLVV